MTIDPYSLFQDVMSQKAAADALVPGQVGYGPNPGVTGALDSDSNTATNTDIALMRSQQSAAPVLAATDADGGVGYSHPAPGTSPSLQMHADVKAAAVQDQAMNFAEELYYEFKSAGLREAAGNVAAGARGAFDRLRGVTPAQPAPPATLAQRAQRAAQTMQEGVADHANRAQKAVANAANLAQQGAANAGHRATAAIRQEPLGAAGLAAGTLGAASGAAALVGGVMANRQAEASKAASLDNAANAGAEFAVAYLRQQGFIQ